MFRALCCGVLLVGCVKTPVETAPPTTGSETHWLRHCDDDAACRLDGARPDARCVCGICSAACDVDDACGHHEVEGRCAAGDSDAVGALCGVLPAGDGLCVGACAADADCGELVCRDGDCVAPEPVAREAGDTFEVPGRPKVDYLFVVDDSGSMCEEQAALSAAFQPIADMLWTEHDFRLAVVSTDGMGQVAEHGAFLRRPTPPVPSLNCRDEGGEPVVPDTADCQGLIDAGALPTILSSDGAEDADRLADQFRCLVTLGTNGDGFEKGLESMRRALSCGGPNRPDFDSCCVGSAYDPEACEDPAFLRPDADLVVIFLTDEDDCSDRPDALISRSENSNCQWDADRLTPVDDYVAFLDGLKPAPRKQIGVAAIVGGQLRTSTGDPVRFVRGSRDAACEEAFEVDACCEGGECPGTIQPSCSGSNGFAFGGDRYVEIASHYLGCDPDSGCGVCTDDLTDPLVTAMQDYVFVRPTYCLEDRPACAVADAGAIRACEGAEADDDRNLVLRVEVWCEGLRCQDPLARTELAASEWRLTDDVTCSSGARIELTDAYPRGTSVRVRYRTSVQ